MGCDLVARKAACQCNVAVNSRRDDVRHSGALLVAGAAVTRISPVRPMQHCPASLPNAVLPRATEEMSAPNVRGASAGRILQAIPTANRVLDSPDRSSYRHMAMRGTKAVEACCPPADEQPDLRPVEGPAADEELTALAKAIGHSARVQILRILVRRDACICGDIVGELRLAQSTVSQHLKVLKDAGLIRGEVDGPRVCYCIEPRALRRLKALIGGL